MAQASVAVGAPMRAQNSASTPGISSAEVNPSRQPDPARTGSGSVDNPTADSGLEHIAEFAGRHPEQAPQIAEELGVGEGLWFTRDEIKELKDELYMTGGTPRTEALRRVMQSADPVEPKENHSGDFTEMVPPPADPPPVEPKDEPGQTWMLQWGDEPFFWVPGAARTMNPILAYQTESRSEAIDLADAMNKHLPEGEARRWSAQLFLPDPTKRGQEPWSAKVGTTHVDLDPCAFVSMHLAVERPGLFQKWSCTGSNERGNAIDTGLALQRCHEAADNGTALVELMCECSVSPMFALLIADAMRKDSLLDPGDDFFEIRSLATRMFQAGIQYGASYKRLMKAGELKGGAQ